MALVFLPETHQYLLDGRELVSVTRVLRAAGLFDEAWFTDESRDRGTRVHRACCRLDDGLPVEDALAEPYLTAYVKFKADLQPVWSHMESPVYDAILGYAGTLDRVGLVGGVLTVLDIKTGEIPPSVGPQTAAYRRCLMLPHDYQRAALQLQPDGRYHYVTLTDRSDEGVFLAALTLWQWKRKYRAREAV